MQVRRKPGAGANIAKAIKAIGGQQSRVGWFPSARYENGTPVALVAIVQEYGSPKHNIPPRSFMRTTQDEKKAEWARDTHVLAKAVADGKMQAQAVLAAVGEKAAGDIRAKIAAIWTPPLKPATIAARGRRHSKGYVSEKPLVDLGYMLNTLTSQVGKK